MANEFSSAGTVFKIGTNAVTGCQGTPDMGSEPEKIDTTSFDNIAYKTYIDGLMDVQSLDFDFIDQTSNFNTAKSAESATPQSYSIEFPDGSKYAWTGTHRTYKVAASVGDPIKFRVSCTPNSELTYTQGT